MHTIYNAAVLVARLFFCVWFVPEGYEKIVDYADTVGYMAQFGVPSWLLPLVIATEIGCGLFLLVGWKTRLFAFLLAGYCVLAVLLFHVPAVDQTDKIIQMAELGDAAGLLVLFAHGGGAWSLDALLAGRKRRLFKGAV